MWVGARIKLVQQGFRQGLLIAAEWTAGGAASYIAEQHTLRQHALLTTRFACETVGSTQHECCL